MDVDRVFRERFDQCMPLEQARVLQELVYEVSTQERPGAARLSIDGKEVVVVGSYVGDRGHAAGRTLGGALWLVDHAPVLLRALRLWATRHVERCGSPSVAEGVLDLSGRIVTALSEEIGLPGEAKLALIARLLSRMGVSLQPASEEWETASLRRIQAYAGEASLSFSGTGYELFVLPWAFEIEMTEPVTPLETRLDSLRQAIPSGVRGLEVSDLELNNWAYMLLLVGRWRAATPMAELATSMERSPCNLDTLGWAYYLEGNVQHAHEVLCEALAGHDAREDPESWAEVAYHKLCALLEVGQADAAVAHLQDMVALAPAAYWTRRARDLGENLGGAGCRRASSGERAMQPFEYDVALSFAGEDRACAELLAVELQRHGVRVFYDEFEKAELWGRNLYEYLTDVYLRRARFCIMLVSKAYAAKRWTKLEREAAQARAFGEDVEYILPVRLDRTELPGILPTVGYLEWETEGAEGIVARFLQKSRRQR